MQTLCLNIFYHSGKGLKYLLESIKSLENNVVKERTSFRMQIQRLKAENAALLLRVQQLTASANKKPGDNSPASKRRNRTPCRRNRSRSSSISSRNRTSSLSPGVHLLNHILLNLMPKILLARFSSTDH